MNPITPILILCIVAAFTAMADDPINTHSKGATNQSIALELRPLQGIWKGVQVDDPSQQSITIAITGDALHFHRDTNFWFKTTVTLPAATNPKQLHATIRACPPSQRDSLGQVVRAFFKVEDDKLTLATIGDDVDDTPKSFDAAGTRYELRKVQPQRKSAQPSKD
jgi:uncharacterized protein (TIGR03067 family)